MIVKAIGIVKNREKKTIGANFHNLSGHKGFYMSTQALKRTKQSEGQITNAVIDTNGYIRAKTGYKLPIFIRDNNSKFLVNTDSINSIPKVNLVKDPLVNKIIHERRKTLLMASRDVNEHNEVIAAIFLDDIQRSEFSFGDESTVNLWKGLQYDVDHSRHSSILIIHNHPSNSRFSLKDLTQFCNGDAILAVEAIGNAGGLYRVVKTTRYNKRLLAGYISLSKTAYMSEVAIVDLIIRESSNIGIKFEFFS